MEKGGREGDCLPFDLPDNVLPVEDGVLCTRETECVSEGPLIGFVSSPNSAIDK